MVQNTKEFMKKCLLHLICAANLNLLTKLYLGIFLMDTIFKYQSNHLQHS